MGGGTIAEASAVAPMPGVLGDESSSSEGKDGGGGNASPPNDAEVGSVDRRSTKAPLEESEDNPEHEPPSARPLNPMPSIGSWWEDDIDMNPAKATLFLGKCSLTFYFYLIFFFVCLPLNFFCFYFF